MTRKEKALENLRNALENLYDNEMTIFNIIGNYKNDKISDIEDGTRYFIAEYNKKQAGIARENYFNTEEGKAKLAEVEEAIKKNEEDRIRIYNERIEFGNKLLEEIGIAPFKIDNVWHYEIYLNDYTSKKPGFLQIEISKNAHWKDEGQKEIKIGVASVGPIDVVEDSAAKRYYMTIGKLFAAGESLKNMVNQIFEFKKDELKKLDDEHNNLNAFIRDPFNTNI